MSLIPRTWSATGKARGTLANATWGDIPRHTPGRAGHTWRIPPPGQTGGSPAAGMRYRTLEDEKLSNRSGQERYSL
jgi:hypothetical protein